jgi:hypothetical protein
MQAPVAYDVGPSRGSYRPPGIGPGGASKRRNGWAVGVRVKSLPHALSTQPGAACGACKRTAEVVESGCVGNFADAQVENLFARQEAKADATHAARHVEDAKVCRLQIHCSANAQRRGTLRQPGSACPRVGRPPAHRQPAAWPAPRASGQIPVGGSFHTCSKNIRILAIRNTCKPFKVCVYFI